MHWQGIGTGAAMLVSKCLYAARDEAKEF